MKFGDRIHDSHCIIHDPIHMMRYNLSVFKLINFDCIIEILDRYTSCNFFYYLQDIENEWTQHGIYMETTT